MIIADCFLGNDFTVINFQLEFLGNKIRVEVWPPMFFVFF